MLELPGTVLAQSPAAGHRGHEWLDGHAHGRGWRALRAAVRAARGRLRLGAGRRRAVRGRGRRSDRAGGPQGDLRELLRRQERARSAEERAPAGQEGRRLRAADRSGADPPSRRRVRDLGSPRCSVSPATLLELRRREHWRSGRQPSPQRPRPSRRGCVPSPRVPSSSRRARACPPKGLSGIQCGTIVGRTAGSRRPYLAVPPSSQR